MFSGSCSALSTNYGELNCKGKVTGTTSASNLTSGNGFGVCAKGDLSSSLWKCTASGASALHLAMAAFVLVAGVHLL